MGFTLQKQFTNPGFGGDNGDVFALDANNVFAVWHDYDGGFTSSYVMFSSSADGGTTWTTPVIADTVNPSVCDLETFSVHTLDGTTIWIAAICYSYSPTSMGSPGALRASKSTDGGATWTNYQPDIDDTNHYISGACQLRATALGGVFISYNTYSYNAATPGTNHNKFAVSTDGGTGWVLTNSSAPNGYGSIHAPFVMCGGSIYVLYDELFFSGGGVIGSVTEARSSTVKSTDCGTTWASPVIVYTSLVSGTNQNSVAWGLTSLDGTTLFATIERGRSPHLLESFLSSDGGASWSDVGTIKSQSGNFGINAGMFQANNSEVLVAYQVSSSVTEWAKTADGGATWAVTTLAAASSTGFSAISGVGPSDIWIYNCNSSGKTDIYKANSSITGAFLSWTTSTCPVVGPPPIIVSLSGTDWLEITEHYVRGGDFNLSGSDLVGLRELPGRTKDLSRSDALAFTDRAERIGGGSYSDRVDIVDTFALLRVKERTDTLVITDSGSTAGSTRKLTGSDLLTFVDGGIATSSAPNVCYEPYVVSPALGMRTDFVLTFPYISPISTVTLRVPLFGNTDVSETGIKVRRTVSNQLSVARGATWPVIRKLKFSFTALPKAQLDAFTMFCLASSGFEIGILDQENRQWRGVITSQIESSQVGPGCDFATSFEFQGRLA